MSKTAVLQLADVGPLDSTVQMLQYAGYRCLLCSKKLQGELRRIGCDTVLDVDDLIRSGSYDPPAFDLGRADDLAGVDLYCDVKAHRSYNKVVTWWPNLKGKVLWARINGAAPEHVVRKCGMCGGSGGVASPHTNRFHPCSLCNGKGTEDCGDEVDPPCPVLTPNQWYSKEEEFLSATHVKTVGSVATMRKPAWAGRAYACWPPFVRWGDYRAERLGHAYTPPLCLVHNLKGWGYGALVDPFKGLGVMMYGDGSPDGPLPHSAVKYELSTALAYVHLKSNDAPGYALYEAMAAGCPVVVPRRLVWRCRMGALLEEGVTCLCFDRETHDPLSPEDVAECTEEVRRHLYYLQGREANRRFGLAGRGRLKSVMWSEERDGPGFRAFMERHFP